MAGEEHVLAIGAHAGDMEFTAGHVLARYVQGGHRATLLHLTLGEKGHHTLSAAEYARQKAQEAQQAAQALGAGVRVLPYRDAETVVTEEAKFAVADIIRAERPTLVITHWKGSVHKDHANTHLIVQDALFYAALRTIERAEPPHAVRKVFFAENWEDPYGFEPETYIDITPVYDRWLDACSAYEIFRPGGAAFAYQDYYKSLARLRGCLTHRFQYAAALMPARWIFRQALSGLL